MSLREGVQKRKKNQELDDGFIGEEEEDADRLVLEMATGTYPSGIGHPYPYLLELSFTRRVTRTRTRVGKRFHTRTRRVIYTRRVTRTRKAYPRITYKYHIFI